MSRNARITLLCLLSTLLSVHAGTSPFQSGTSYDLKPGDIVFQETGEAQAMAVKAATNSRWSHVGIVFFHQEQPWVLEALQPVKTTPLKSFIDRSPESFYAMRLKHAHLHINARSVNKAQQYAQLQLGKNYDPYFQWSDTHVYCSELVWKIYKHSTGIELCQPRILSSYNLHHPMVQTLIKKRYGSMSKLPMNELMVAPSDLAESNLLIEVPRKQRKTILSD